MTALRRVWPNRLRWAFGAGTAVFYVKGGVPNPTLDVFLTTLELTDADKRHLVAFMGSLTGTMPAIERPTLPR